MLLFLGRRPSRNPPWRLLNFQNVCAVFSCCLCSSFAALASVCAFFMFCCCLVLFVLLVCASCCCSCGFCCLCCLCCCFCCFVFFCFVCCFCFFAAAFAAAFGSPTVEKTHPLPLWTFQNVNYTFYKPPFTSEKVKNNFLYPKKHISLGQLKFCQPLVWVSRILALCARHTSLRTFDELQTRIQTFLPKVEHETVNLLQKPSKVRHLDLSCPKQIQNRLQPADTIWVAASGARSWRCRTTFASILAFRRASCNAAFAVDSLLCL